MCCFLLASAVFLKFLSDLCLSWAGWLQNTSKYYKIRQNGSKKEYKYIKSDPKWCPGGAKVPPKCSKWSSWGHLGGPGPSKWSPWGSLWGSKWGPWGLVGTLWGVMGVWEAQGTKKYHFLTSFWYQFETKMCSKTDMENNTKIKYIFSMNCWWHWGVKMWEYTVNTGVCSRLPFSQKVNKTSDFCCFLTQICHNFWW